MSTERDPEQQSIYDQIQTPRDSTIPTDRMHTHRTNAVMDHQLTERKINVDNFEKGKIGQGKNLRK